MLAKWSYEWRSHSGANVSVQCHGLIKSDLTTASVNVQLASNRDQHLAWCHHLSRKPSSHLVVSWLHCILATLEGEVFYIEGALMYIMGIGLPFLPAQPRSATPSKGLQNFDPLAWNLVQHCIKPRDPLDSKEVECWVHDGGIGFNHIPY